MTKDISYHLLVECFCLALSGYLFILILFWIGKGINSTLFSWPLLISPHNDWGSICVLIGIGSIITHLGDTRNYEFHTNVGHFGSLGSFFPLPLTLPMGTELNCHSEYQYLTLLHPPTSAILALLCKFCSPCTLTPTSMLRELNLNISASETS